MVVRRSDLDVAQQRDQGPRQTRDYIVVFGGITCDEARPGAVQGRAGAPGLRHGQQLARGARDQRVVAGQGRAQPADPRRAQGVVDPDRPAPAGGPRSSTSTTRAGPRSCSPRPAYPSGFKIPSRPRPATARTTWTRCRSRSRTGRQAGIEAELKLKEYGAFVSSTIFGKFEKMMLTLRGATTDPDSYFTPFMPGEPLNSSGVNDPKLTEMIKLQRRTFDEQEAPRDRLRHPALRLPAGLLRLRGVGERGRAPGCRT